MGASGPLEGTGGLGGLGKLAKSLLQNATHAKMADVKMADVKMAVLQNDTC